MDQFLSHTHTNLFGDDPFRDGTKHVFEMGVQSCRRPVYAFHIVCQNIVPEFKDQSWKKRLNSLGLTWHLVYQNNRWNDYSYIDAVCAVRSFEYRDYSYKTGSKLYNAWLAGVPAVLGVQASYRAERRSYLDYIEVSSLEESVDALKRLRDDRELRRKMRENATVRAQEFTPKKIIETWKHLLTDIAAPMYKNWCGASTFTRIGFLVTGYIGTVQNLVETRGKRQFVYLILRRLRLLNTYLRVKKLIIGR